MMILKRRHIEAEINNRVGLSGEYKLIVRHGDGTIKRETEWFDNLILDSGLNAMGTIAAIDRCAIGTGTTAAVASQTALIAFSASTTNTTANAGSVQATAPYYSTRTITFRFALGALNGNYSEVGVGWANASMFSRALIVDGVGAPTTITVGSAEQLDVVYRLKTYLPTADVTGVVTISGVNYNMIGRVSQAASDPITTSGSAGSAVVEVGYPYNSSFGMTIYAGQIGTVTNQPSGVQTSESARTNVAYTNNSLVRQSVYPIALSTNLAANVPMKSFTFNTFGLGALKLQYQFEKVSDGTGIPKDPNKTLSMTFQIGWGRRP